MGGSMWGGAGLVFFFKGNQAVMFSLKASTAMFSSKTLTAWFP